MSRLQERMEERLQRARASQAAVVLVVGLVVLLRLTTYAFTAFYLLQGDLAMYRATQVVGTAFAAVLDALLVLLVWMLFQAVDRTEREAERVQTFMDNVYRKLLK